MTLWLLLQDWADFGLRWLHVVTAIFWVGAALAFLRINLNLKALAGATPSFETRVARAPQDEDAGTPEIWRGADDGFFHIDKRPGLPADAQPQMNWFRWEAYATWASGLGLMIAHYFVNADLYLIEPDVMLLTPAWAIGIAVGALIVAWLVYDFLCKAPFRWSENFRRAAIFVFLVATVFGLTRVFSGRGALLEFGAIIGTLMVANVAHVLVPNQRKMLAALRAGAAPDESLFAASRQRALHNNYFALPVIFLMLSNHYPLAYASRFAWIIASLALVVGAALRHFYVVRHRGGGNRWSLFALAGAGMAAIVWLSALGAARPYKAAAADDASQALASVVAPGFADVEAIVADRCVACHAREPAWDGLAAAPKGVRLDAPDLIRRHADEIAKASIWTHAMPPGGAAVDMSEGERAIIAAWLKAGAPAH